MAGDDTVRLTYGELAEVRGISLASARRMVHRHKWPKQVGNDGLSRIAVPAEFATRSADSDATNDVIDDAGNGPTDDATDGDITDMIPDATPNTVPLRVVAFDDAVAAFAQVTTDAINGTTRDVIVALQEAITTLRTELYEERERADRAEEQVRELQERLARRWWKWGR